MASVKKARMTAMKRTMVSSSTRSAVATASKKPLRAETNSSEQRMIRDGGDRGFSVTEKEGRLLCHCSDYIQSEWGWCEHLEDVIQKGQDSHPSGSIHADFLHYPAVMEVPIFPRLLPTLEVKVGDIENDGSRAVKADFGADPSPGLGWIYPGEARRTIRMVFLDWLRGQYRIVPNCKSVTHHNTRWTVHDERGDEPKGQEILADIWSLYVHGVCRTCLQYNESFDQDAPDL